MKIITDNEKIENDLFDVLHMFYPTYERNEEYPVLFHKTIKEGNNITNNFVIKFEDAEYNISETNILDNVKDFLEQKRKEKRFAKLALYKLISNITNKKMPWGSLTGIRPTKVAYDLINQGVEHFLIKETLMNSFLVSEQKAKLVEQVIQNQKCIINNDNLVDLYINIPFCPSRCFYCSFISSEFSRVEKLIPTYLEALVKELNETKKIINQKAYIVRTIYIGGGTPTVLSAEQLDYLLSNISYPVSEFTVECGRPDTITAEKLYVLKKHNVTRISINPQTFVDATLKKIGRKHTVKDVIEAYKLALPYDFDVNMDLIAGLPGETFRSFKKSLDMALQLAPNNITVHTLAIKNGSLFANEIQPEERDNNVAQMVEYSYNKLLDNDYKPYYLYKLKNQTSGQENVGYFRDKVCIFNIDSMEESCSILACGANAISKRIYHNENKIERFANVKDINEYINRIDEMIEKKKNLYL